MADDWYSDKALAQMAEVERKRAAGEEFTWSDLWGICEPRVLPAAHEKCEHCGGDAREPAGGNGLFCNHCLNRDRDEDYSDVELEEMRADRKARAGESEEVAS